MFRSKRSSLAKRLLKKIITRSPAIDPNNEEWRRQLEPTTANDRSIETEDQQNSQLCLESCLQSMLKQLKESQLKSLFRAIDSKGGQVSDCVLFRKDALKIGRRAVVEPHVLCCQVWRWPHVRHKTDLKPLLWCHCSQTDPIYVCINPYHWTQICGTDSCPPPYYSICSHRTSPQLEETPVIDSNVCQRLSTVEQTVSPIMSTETIGSLRHELNSHFKVIQTSDGRQHWCTLAYWELRNRVGRLFPVYGDAINVFAHLPQGEGLWLEPWFSSSLSNKEQSVRRTRDKIGFGVTITREEDGVWVYNRSNIAIFVNSPTLDAPNTRNLTVYKVLPGFSIKVFDFEVAQNYRRLRAIEPPEGPMDPNAFRISFAKGWGPDYSRQYVTSCPCWMEVLLAVTDKVKRSLSHLINS